MPGLRLDGYARFYHRSSRGIKLIRLKLTVTLSLGEPARSLLRGLAPPATPTLSNFSHHTPSPLATLREIILCLESMHDNQSPIVMV